MILARPCFAFRRRVAVLGTRAASACSAPFSYGSGSRGSDASSRFVVLTAGVTAVAGFHSSRPTALCHDGHSHGHSHDGHDEQMAVLARRIALLEENASARYGAQASSGQGDAVFSWEEALTAAMPGEARTHEKKMHGGFNEDMETGVVYTGIPGAGMYSISPDLRTWTKFGNDARLKDNIHGIVVFNHRGAIRIVVAQNEMQRVLIMDGKTGAVLQELTKPRGGEFDFAEANAFYSERRHTARVQLTAISPNTDKVFACTDVTFLENKLYVSTGYCDGDFVLTAECDADGRWTWGPVAWGGKGDGAGKFRTAHGITAYDGHIYVSNREAFQVVKFRPDGSLVEVLPDIPGGSRICNVARAEDHGYFFMNALAPLPHTAPRTAPIYAHTGEQLISTIDAGSLGIPVLKHLHHVWPHYITDKDGKKRLHLLVHGWRDGKFAVLKHEPQAPAAMAARL